MELKTLTSLGAMVPYSLIGLLAILWGQWLLQMVERYRYHAVKAEMLHNWAANIRMAGLYVAVGLGLSGVFAGEGRSFLEDLGVSAVYTLVTPILVMIAIIVNDVFILPGVNNTKEVQHGNLAVAVVEVGGLIATGHMIKAAMIGDSNGLTIFIATLVFFGLGQVAMVLLVRIYEAVLSKLPIVAEVEKGNVAAGLILGGKLWAYGLIMSTAVGGSFKGWITDLGSFAFTAAAGMLFLYAAEWAIDKWLVRWRTVAQILAPQGTDQAASMKNVSAAFAHAGAKIGMAYVISSVVV